MNDVGTFWNSLCVDIRKMSHTKSDHVLVGHIRFLPSITADIVVAYTKTTEPTALLYYRGRLQ